MSAEKMTEHGVYMWHLESGPMLVPVLQCRGCSRSVCLFGCCCMLSCHYLQHESSHTHTHTTGHATHKWDANMSTGTNVLYDTMLKRVPTSKHAVGRRHSLSWGWNLLRNFTRYRNLQQLTQHPIWSQMLHNHHQLPRPPYLVSCYNIFNLHNNHQFSRNWWTSPF